MSLEAERLLRLAFLAEATYPNILKGGLYGPTRQRAQRTQVKLVRAMPKLNMWIFHATGSEPWSDPAGHTVRMKAVSRGQTKDPLKLDLLAQCTCPAWKWWGSDYWAYVGGYLYGKPRSNKQPPNIRDPNHIRPFCKHVVAAADLFRGFKVRKPKKP